MCLRRLREDVQRGYRGDAAADGRPCRPGDGHPAQPAQPHAGLLGEEGLARGCLGCSCHLAELKRRYGVPGGWLEFEKGLGAIRALFS